MLSVDTLIVTSEIEHIRMFKDLKVWCLVGANDDKLVVKIDAVERNQIKSVSPIVKAIAPDSKFKILTNAERDALRQFVADFNTITDCYKELGMQYRPEEEPAVKDLGTSLGFPEPFVKMPFAANSNLETALENRLSGDKADLASFAATLNAPGGLERLGEIVAADLVSGNTDRFFPGSNSSRTIGGVTFNLRCLVNVGNVFKFTMSGGATRMGALDFIDPNSRFKDINISLAQAEAKAGAKWPGRVLANKSARDGFAKDIVHDLEKILAPRKHALSLKTKLSSSAASRISAGMVTGAHAIKRKLESKYNPNRWTQGAKDRYMIIAQVR